MVGVGAVRERGWVGLGWGSGGRLSGGTAWRQPSAMEDASQTLACCCWSPCSSCCLAAILLLLWLTPPPLCPPTPPPLCLSCRMKVLLPHPSQLLSTRACRSWCAHPRHSPSQAPAGPAASMAAAARGGPPPLPAAAAWPGTAAGCPVPPRSSSLGQEGLLTLLARPGARPAAPAAACCWRTVAAPRCQGRQPHQGQVHRGQWRARLRAATSSLLAAGSAA